jgi:hypothetical protein
MINLQPLNILAGRDPQFVDLAMGDDLGVINIAERLSLRELDFMILGYRLRYNFLIL